MWALRRRNTHISNDFVMRFLRPLVKRPQTEKMRSTKACDAGTLIRSCAKGASRGYTGIRCSQNCKASDAGGLLLNSIMYLFISDWAVSLVGGLTADCFADRNFHLFAGGGSQSVDGVGTAAIAPDSSVTTFACWIYRHSQHSSNLTVSLWMTHT